MAASLLFLTYLAFASALQDCQTPSNQPGKCVLINHCPFLFSSALRNQTEKPKSLLQKSFCGFEGNLFLKICCPEDAIKFYGETGAISHNQHSTQCGLHTPEGPSDPWLALLEYEKPDGDRSVLCGGVLINKRHVLTSAHCLTGSTVPQGFRLINVHLGVYNTDSPLILPVDGTSVHEEYNPQDPNRYNDIGLVRLKNKINFKQEFARPICIPMHDKKDFLGKKLQLTGYEKLENSMKKRDAIATVWNSTECHLTYDLKEIKLRDSQICAGGRKLPYLHSLRIDYGGILMHVANDNTYTAVGILSLQPPCCNKDNYPKVFTRIASYVGWIINNLKP